MGPVSGEEQKKRILARLARERRLGENDPTQYLLSAEEMCNNEYPLPSYVSDVSQLGDGWVETSQNDPIDASLEARSNVLALDCEMVSFT